MITSYKCWKFIKKERFFYFFGDIQCKHMHNERNTQKKSGSTYLFRIMGVIHIATIGKYEIA